MNNDLISRSALMEKAGWVNLYEQNKSANVVFVSDVCAAPAVDAVEVCRCKDCIHYEFCKNGVAETDFCSSGERREDG